MATPEKIKEKNKLAVEKYRTSQKYRDRLRNARYKSKYGISLNDYNDLLIKQNGVCAICFCPETGKGVHKGVKTLAVDHCHGTGKVRGLLCNNCNCLLGYAKDNLKVLAKAIQYIKENNGDL